MGMKLHLVPSDGRGAASSTQQPLIFKCVFATFGQSFAEEEQLFWHQQHLQCRSMAALALVPHYFADFKKCVQQSCVCFSL